MSTSIVVVQLTDETQSVLAWPLEEGEQLGSEIDDLGNLNVIIRTAGGGDRALVRIAAGHWQFVTLTDDEDPNYEFLFGDANV